MRTCGMNNKDKQYSHTHMNAQRNLDQTGQHYMIDRGLIKEIVSAASLKKSDCVFEIGFGKGALTYALANKCTVVAIDIEPASSQLTTELSHVTFIQGNVLEEFDATYQKYAFNKIVANIPYMLSEPLMRKVFKTPPECVVLTVGEDFSEIVHKRNNRIGIIANQLFDVEVLQTVSPDAFFPRPRVYSAVIRMKKKKHDSVAKIYTQLIALHHKKLKNAFTTILVYRTKKEIKELTTMPLFSKKLYELDNAEFILLDKFIHLLCMK